MYLHNVYIDRYIERWEILYGDPILWGLYYGDHIMETTLWVPNFGDLILWKLYYRNLIMDTIEYEDLIIET